MGVKSIVMTLIVAGAAVLFPVQTVLSEDGVDRVPQATTTQTPSSAEVGSSTAGVSGQAPGSATMGYTMVADMSSVRLADLVNLTMAKNKKTSPAKKRVTPSPTPVPSTGRTIALGVFRPGAPWNMATVADFESKVGKKVGVVNWYQSWADEVKDFNPGLLANVANRGATPMISWEPWHWGGGVNQPAFSLSEIAAGNYDAYIESWAVGARNYGKPFFIRFAHEMNGDWYPWGAAVNGNTPQSYVSAWRHVHDIFRRAGATNVFWVWCPNIEYYGSTDIAKLYPGDDYVDWVGIDGYNFGSTRDWSSWTSFSDIFSKTYGRVAAMTNKPVMIAETASAEQGGDKALWVSDALTTQLVNHFPTVQAFLWFDENKELDWRVESSESSLAAFRSAVAASLYSSTVSLQR